MGAEGATKFTAGNARQLRHNQNITVRKPRNGAWKYLTRINNITRAICNALYRWDCASRRPDAD